MARYAGFYSDSFANRYGVAQTHTDVYVYEINTDTLATLYTDRTKQTTGNNPFRTDAWGNGWFYADPGQYDVVANDTRVRIGVPVDIEGIEEDLTEAGTFIQQAQPADSAAPYVWWETDGAGNLADLHVHTGD